MKVSELIASTTWAPGRALGTSPAVSVLLPTFRRGADGLLRRVIDRICAQTFNDFELIIIDDASTDGSADIIRDAMVRDGRIGCLTHPQNIGLPAVSEYEGFIRARGEYVVFAFDDYLFEPDAFERLMQGAKAHPGCVVHGYSHMPAPDGQLHVLGRGDIGYDLLLFGNYIANSSYIVPRPVLEDVGLYDPHVLSARLCDWDLLRRIERKHRLVPIDALIGSELGYSRKDSLGHTYPVTFEVMQEMFGADRDAQLRPPQFADYDVWSFPQRASCGLMEAAIEARQNFTKKGWAETLPLLTPEETMRLMAPERTIIGIIGDLGPTLALFFNGLPDELRPGLQFIKPGGEGDFALARQCDAVIVVRDIFAGHVTPLITECRENGTKLIYFTDDHFALVDDFRNTAYADIDHKRDFLKDFAAVWCGSPRLASHFRDIKLHPRLVTIDPVFDRKLVAKYANTAPLAKPQGDYALGVIAGDFRKVGLVEDILPAIETMASRDGIRLVLADTLDIAGLPCPSERVGRSSFFGLFIDRWRGKAIDVVLHPRCATANVAYKNDNILLSALYIGAVPVLPNEPAFDGLDETHGVVRVASDRPSEWRDAIERLRDPAFRAQLLHRLERYCAERFSGASNVAALNDLMAETPPANLLTRMKRLKRNDQRIARLEQQVGSRTFKLALRLRDAAIRLQRLRQRARSLLSIRRS